MVRGGVMLALLLAGCGYTPPVANDARPPDGSGGGSDDGGMQLPCVLPSLSLHAATLAGCETKGTADGVRGTGRFNNPVNLALAASGTAYVADFDGNKLRKVDTAGTTTTLVTQPTLPRPFGVVFSPDGWLYVETDDDDLGAHTTSTGTIWKVNPATGAATVIARDIGRPRGIALLQDGRLALCDYMHHVVELLDPGSGAVTVLAGTLDVPGHINGTGTSALFASPWDLLVVNGDLIVSELDNHVLRRVTLQGVVTDYVGTAGSHGHNDGPIATALFDGPKGLAIDASGAIYITEANNHDIRKLKSGMVTTVAGVPGTGGWFDSDDTTQAQFYGVEGLDVSPDGSRIVVADGTDGDGTDHNHVRIIHQ